MKIAAALAAVLIGAASLGAVQPADQVKNADVLPLATVKRIYVDQLGGGGESDALRDMIIAALQNSGLFVITENPDRADASLRGSADDKIFMENHSTQESIGMHSAGGQGDSSSEGGVGRVSKSSHSNFGVGLTDSESSHIEVRRHEANASVRLVDTNGDVIWSTTQESGGGKFRGAAADVADRVARNLMDAVRKAREASAAKTTDAKR
jgi:hypothetical protein